MAAPDETRPAIAWAWSDAALGALYALPAAAVMSTDISKGLAFGVGVVPAAVVGLQPKRRGRPLLIVVGTMAGVSLFIGAALSHVPWLAVPALFLLAVGAAELAQRRRVGQLIMFMALPLVGVGLSYTDLHEAGGLALILIAGSVYACAVSMLWPEHDRPSTVVPPGGSLLGYGIRLGLAAATAAAIGFALGLEHVGWACAAALLVMRPAREMQEIRSLGRLGSVIVGGLAGGVLAHYTSNAGIYAVAIVVVVTAAAATHTSRWYLTPGFTTFIVLSLLVYANPDQAALRFDERVVETILGVAIAYLYGLALPAAYRRRDLGHLR